MGRCGGGRSIRGKLEELDSALDEYYGTLNEQSTGLITVTVPEKPEALVLWEQCQALGLPLIQGAVLDQPYIWLQEVAAVVERKALWALLANANKTE